MGIASGDKPEKRKKNLRLEKLWKNSGAKVWLGWVGLGWVELG